MVNTVIAFLLAMIFAWFCFLGLFWLLEIFHKLTNWNFFRISVDTWLHSWKSWAFTFVFTLLCVLTRV